MNKPENYDLIPAMETGSFAGPQAGAYILGIVRAEVGKTKTGKEKITLYLDIANGEFKNYYRELSVKMQRDCYLKQDQLTEGEKSIPYFKGMIKAIEESNTGYKFNFDEKTLSRKLVGGVLQEKEYYNKGGELKSILVPFYLCSVERINAGNIPIPPVLKADRPTNTNTDSGAFCSDNLAPEEDLPF